MSELKDLVLKLATEFINIPAESLDEHINSTLAMAGTYLAMDRAYLFEYDLEARTMTNTHEWCAQGITPHIQDLQDLPMEDYPEWVDAHLHGTPIKIASVDALPEGNLKSALQMQSIRSLIAYPLMDGKSCLGFVGFDSVRRHRQWSDDDVSLIMMIAEIYANVLKKKEMARRLKASERQYMELVEGLPIGLYRRTPGPEGTFIMANQALARIFGYERGEELIGLKISSFCADIKKMKQCGLELAKTGMIKEKETRFKRRNGEVFWVSISARQRCDQHGNPVYVEGIVQDISDRKRQEEEKEQLQAQLEQVQRIESIGRLAGGVAHDFNNLLVPILGYSELLMNSLAPSDRLRRYVEPIMEAGERARDIVRQLLAFSSSQVMEKSPVDLNLLLKRFRRFLRHTLREDIKIELRLCSRHPVIEADSRQIEQVVLNLAVNAQDAMPRGGTLTISTELATAGPKGPKAMEGGALSSIKPAGGPFVVLTVSDTGTGIAPEVRQHIFEPFFTTKGHENGTGLGLATVYGIVKQHGGVIEVSSGPEGGSTFRIYLPVAEIRQGAAGEELEAPEIQKSGGGTILLVEDDKEVRDFVLLALDQAGYHVMESEGPLQALEEMENRGAEIDLLLTDVIMPEMNGKELYQRLRQRHPGLKVLYMSGYAPEELDLEADGSFLAKPFSISQLTSAVKEALQKDEEDS